MKEVEKKRHNQGDIKNLSLKGENHSKYLSTTSHPL
jgi:hypothetical protein